METGMNRNRKRFTEQQKRRCTINNVKHIYRLRCTDISTVVDTYHTTFPFSLLKSICMVWKHVLYVRTVCEVFAQFLETNQPHCMFKSLSAIFAVFTCTANFGGQFDIMISYHSHHILSWLGLSIACFLACQYSSCGDSYHDIWFRQQKAFPFIDSLALLVSPKLSGLKLISAWRPQNRVRWQIPFSRIQRIKKPLKNLSQTTFLHLSHLKRKP